MSHQRLIALLCCFALFVGSLSGCSKQTSPEPEAPADYPLEIGTTKILERPKSVVTLSPSLTQTLVDLGLDGRIVGIGDYCTPPPLSEGETYPYQRCGAPQMPSIPAIKELHPDVVFTSAPMSQGQLTSLQQEDIDVVVIPPAHSFQQLRQNYTDLFRALWGDHKGEEMASDFLKTFDAKLEDIHTRATKGAQSQESTLVGVYLTADLLNIATGDTLEGQILQLLGLENAGEAYTDYVYPKEKEVDLNPDVIFSSGLVSKEVIASSSCYKTTPAIKENRLYEVPGEELERQAPSMLFTIWKMGKTLYPDAFYVEPPVDRGY